MAAKRRQRFDVHGLVVLDKPTGLTSNEALQRVKSLYRARKAGHTGSLDPLASGLLPICFGEATKISGFLLDADKRYRIKCKLGVRTDSGDSDGQVVEQHEVPQLTKAGVEKVLAGFLGPIEQIPPMYSAVKHHGKRLYELAREGVEVERAPRTVTIHDLSLLSLAGDELVLEVSCSKGTYVRVLAEDLGRVLGCGAHVSAMRRLSSGPYGESDMITLEELEQRAAAGRDELLEVLKPIESALIHWPRVRLSDDAAHYLRQGQAVLVPRAPSDGWVRLYEGPDLESARFVGVGEILNDGRVAPRRLIRTA